jgi:AcrR family transcriptional regulator
MTTTPWGEAERLRSRRLAPGPGKGQEAVLASQRERLLAATVAVVADKGYEATRVEDVLVMAGVSRNSFYKQFSNKRECFLATLEAVTGIATPMVIDAFEQTDGPWDRKLSAMLDSLAAVVVAQPAMARVSWVEIYAAGPKAVEIVAGVDRTVEDIVCRALKDSPERAGIPLEVVRAIVGGVRKIVYTRVRDGHADELAALMPELFDWMQGYHTPPEPLRRPRRVPAELAAPLPEPRDAGDRIVRAVAELVAEKGYPETAITEIAARAAVSLTTFYARFEGKEAAFMAALADAQQRAFDFTAAHFAAAPDWPRGVAAAVRAFLGFLATDPAMAQLGGVGVWASSPAALKLRDQGGSLFGSLLDDGFRLYPDTNRLVAETIGATLDALLFISLSHKGAERSYAMAPVAIFIALAPFVGTDRACELANETPVEVS